MYGDIYLSFRARMLMNFGLICCFLNQVPAGLILPTSVAMFLIHLSPEAHDFFSPSEKDFLSSYIDTRFYF